MKSNSPEENHSAERVATPNPSQLQAHYGWGLPAWMKIGDEFGETQCVKLTQP